MGILALIVRLLIAATFSVAGIAKLFDLPGAQKGIQDFGVPTWVATPLGIFLPFAELAFAALLIPVSTVRWGALGAFTLLLIFIIGIGVNLALGRKPECNCFGQLHSEPIGWPTLVRNSVLLVGAGVVLWEARGASPMRFGLSKVEAVGIVLGMAGLLVVAAEGWLTFHLLRQNGRLLLRMDALEAQFGSGIAFPSAKVPLGLPIGSPAPTFELRALSDHSIFALDSLWGERLPVALIFSDPDCGPCSAMLPDIARWQQEHAATLEIALISRGSQKANRLKIGEHRLKYVLVQKDREVAAAYHANGTPSAVLIGPDGKIASFLAMGSQAIASLVATAGAGTLPAVPLPANGRYGSGSAVPTARVELKIGEPAPSLKLPDLGGRIIDLSSLRGRDALILFWNPNCGFCAKMLPDLKRWEEDLPAGAPQLLVVSSGTVEANRAMGLRAPVVLDQGFTSGMAFHAGGTPAAVLVNSEGKIASRVASGALAVFALANAQHGISV